MEREVSYGGMTQYQQLAQSHIGLYVEEELYKYFPRLIDFVKTFTDLANNPAALPVGHGHVVVIGGGSVLGAVAGSGGGGGPVAVASAAAATMAALDAEAAGTLLLQFEREWKEAVKRIDADIIVGFSNFRMGSDILKKVGRVGRRWGREVGWVG